MIDLPASPRVSLLLVRAAAGLTMSTHGFSKMFLGFREPLGGFLESMGVPLPHVVAWSITLLELSGVLYALGVLTRPLALYYIFQLVLGIILVHGQHGWYTVGPGRNGIEFSVLLIVTHIAVILAGTGWLRHRLALGHVDRL